MKMAIKRANGVFGHNSQTCIVSYRPCKSPYKPETVGIAHENDHKTRKRRVFCIPLKHVSGLTSHANRHGTRKIWAIAHENGHKTRKLWGFGPNPQTCIGSLKPRKSPRNSENCGQ